MRQGNRRFVCRSRCTSPVGSDDLDNVENPLTLTCDARAGAIRRPPHSGVMKSSERSRTMRWLGYRGLLAIGLCACGTSTGPTMGTSGSGSSGSGTSSTTGSATGAGTGSATSSGTTTGASATGASGAVASGTSGGISSGVATSGIGSGASTGAATMSGSASGASGGSGASGASGSSSSGTSTTPFPSGMSAGCGMAPVNGNQNIMVPSCAAGAITPKCISPDFQPGGVGYIKTGNYDFNNREFAILAIPTNYDGTKAFPVILEGGGCTSGPTNNGGGYNAGEGGNDIRIGLSYVAGGGCFADGGEFAGMPSGFGCSPDEAHIGICVNNPEVPYVNAILDFLEAHFCVDLGNIFIGGYSSGAWEASTVSCALANRIRGMSTTFGGMRIHRAACTGPTAALMLAGLADNSNPIGPMVENMALPSVGLSATQVNDDILFLDSNGSAPMRDELLTRNGCTGTATAMYSAAYPQCMNYTGCPADYPVVWCPLTGVGHGGGDVVSGNIHYENAAWDFLSKLPAP